LRNQRDGGGGHAGAAEVEVALPGFYGDRSGKAAGRDLRGQRGKIEGGVLDQRDFTAGANPGRWSGARDRSFDTDGTRDCTEVERSGIAAVGCSVDRDGRTLCDVNLALIGRQPDVPAGSVFCRVEKDLAVAARREGSAASENEVAGCRLEQDIAGRGNECRIRRNRLARKGQTAAEGAAAGRCGTARCEQGDGTACRQAER
jgi:hypothetical protein